MTAAFGDPRFVGLQGGGFNPGLFANPLFGMPMGVPPRAKGFKTPAGGKGRGRGSGRGSAGGDTYGSAAIDPDEGFVTVMLRNIPNKYTRQMLMEQFHRVGFKHDIDYVYLPIDFANRCNVGYCFINFRSAAARQRFCGIFDGQAAQSCLPGFNSFKVCTVTKAKWQGREENIRRLKSGPELMAQLVQHPEWLPLIFDEKGDPEEFIVDSTPPSGNAGRGRGSGEKRGARGKKGDKIPDLLRGPGKMSAHMPVMTAKGLQYIPVPGAAGNMFGSPHAGWMGGFPTYPFIDGGSPMWGVGMPGKGGKGKWKQSYSPGLMMPMLGPFYDDGGFDDYGDDLPTI